MGEGGGGVLCIGPGKTDKMKTKMRVGFAACLPNRNRRLQGHLQQRTRSFHGCPQPAQPSWFEMDWKRRRPLSERNIKETLKSKGKKGKQEKKFQRMAIWSIHYTAKQDKRGSMGKNITSLFSMNSLGIVKFGFSFSIYIIYRVSS